MVHKWNRAKAKVEFKEIKPGDMGTVMCATKRSLNPTALTQADQRVEIQWDKGGSHNWLPGQHFDVCPPGT